MDRLTQFARYVVILDGEGPFCQVAEGRAAMLRLVMANLWDGDDPPPDVVAVRDEIEDPDAWEHDDRGPFRFTADLGDGRVTIYRVQD